MSTMNRAHSWMEKNYKIDIGPKCFYYLVRPGALQELSGSVRRHTRRNRRKWYNDGYEFLAEKQQPDGSWTGYCGPECDTAFSILFLLALHAKEHPSQTGRRHAARRPRSADESGARQVAQRPADCRSGPHQSR